MQDQFDQSKKNNRLFPKTKCFLSKGQESRSLEEGEFYFSIDIQMPEIFRGPSEKQLLRNETYKRKNPRGEVFEIIG